MLVGLSGCAGPAQEYCQRLGEIWADPSLTCEDDPYSIDLRGCITAVSNHCTDLDVAVLNSELDCGDLRDCEKQEAYDECKLSPEESDCRQLDAFFDCLRMEKVSELCDEGLVAAEF